MRPWKANRSLDFAQTMAQYRLPRWPRNTCLLVFGQTWLCKYETDPSCALHSSIPTCSGDCVLWPSQTLTRTSLTTGVEIAVNLLPLCLFRGLAMP